jgi:hypothetical protein
MRQTFDVTEEGVVMSDATSSARGWMPRIGGLAAVLAAGVLLIGIAGLATGSSALRPWLAVLFGIDSEVGGVSMGSLKVVNPIDILLLVLTGVTFAGFWPGPGKPHRLWIGLAILLPFAGIGVLVATGLAGRSGLMGGLLVLSLLMLGERSLRLASWVGIAASLLLLVGDFATTGPPSALGAGVVAVGYALLVGWFAWVAFGLLGARNPSGTPSHS